MIHAKSKLKYVAFSAIVKRADGTVEDLGIIAEQHFTVRGKLIQLINRVIKRLT